MYFDTYMGKEGNFVMDSFIIRNIDELGRVVLPKEWRNFNKIREKDPIELHIKGRAVTLQKHEESCVFCGKEKNLQKYNDRLVCEKCINNLIKEVSK
jgi:transcriptional pleiotropic regulator of transition state genes